LKEFNQDIRKVFNKIVPIKKKVVAIFIDVSFLKKGITECRKIEFNNASLDINSVHHFIIHHGT